MPNNNTAFLVGHIGKEPEFTYVGEKRTPLCKFSLATNFKEGSYEESTWHNIVVWGSLAEYVANLFHKGNSVQVLGRIRNRSYDKKDGSGKGYTSEIIASIVVPAGEIEPSDLNDNDKSETPEAPITKDAYPW